MPCISKNLWHVFRICFTYLSLQLTRFSQTQRRQICKYNLPTMWKLVFNYFHRKLQVQTDYSVCGIIIIAVSRIDRVPSCVLCPLIRIDLLHRLFSFIQLLTVSVWHEPYHTTYSDARAKFLALNLSNLRMAWKHIFANKFNINKSLIVFINLY